MEKLLVSACMLGISCRYDGKSKRVLNENVLARLSQKYELVPFCPEIYGGLPTPRTPSEIVSNEVYMKDGTNVTENYKRGACEALRLCDTFGIKKALLKERSPSCGKGQIYDGSFQGKLISGNGVTTELLLSAGILVFGESEAEELLV